VTTTAERIAAVHQTLSPRFEIVPECWTWEPDAPNDYPFATWRYIKDGCPHYTFDVHWLIPEWVVAHELGHAIHALAGGDPINIRLDDTVLMPFWREAGFAVTWDEAYGFYLANRQHKYAPSEHFADAFSYLTYGGFGDCDPGIYGGKWDEATLARLDVFFKSIRAEVIEVTEEEVRRLLEGYVSKTELEAYKRALQQQVDDTLALRTHGHTVTTTVS